MATIGFFIAKSWALAATPEWGQWRGDGSGASPVTNLPMDWGVTKNVRWSVPVPGYGWSCPVVAGGKIFLTTAITNEQQAPLRQGPGGGSPAPDKVFRWEVHCLDAATGRTLWTQLAAEHKPAMGTHLSNTYASETPVTDGERVYAWFAAAGLFAYTLDGQAAWRAELGEFRTSSDWGSSNSPVLADGRLFVLCDNAERSFLVALDARTGKELWRTSRDERSTWSTPYVWRNVRRTEIVALGSGYMRSYDPATGRELWRLASERSLRLPDETPGNITAAPPAPDSARSSERRAGPDGPPPPGRPGDARTAGGGPPRRGGPGGPPGGGAGGKQKMSSGGCKASPVASADLIYVSCAPRFPGYKLGPLWAVKAGASGDLSLRSSETSSAAVAWYRYGAGAHFSSALLHEDRLYVFPSHTGEPLTCFDARTGATIYAESLPGHGGFKASPCVAGGKIFCTDQRGTTFVVEAGAQFQLVGKNVIDELTWSSPALAGGAIFLRTVGRLYCIGTGR